MIAEFLDLESLENVSLVNGTLYIVARAALSAATFVAPNIGSTAQYLPNLVDLLPYREGPSADDDKYCLWRDRIRQTHFRFTTVDYLFPDSQHDVLFAVKMYVFHRSFFPYNERVIFDFTALEVLPPVDMESIPETETRLSVNANTIKRILEHFLDTSDRSWEKIIIRTAGYRHHGDRLFIERYRGPYIQRDDARFDATFFSEMFPMQRPVSLFGEPSDRSPFEKNMVGMKLIYQSAGTPLVHRSEKSAWRKTFTGLMQKDQEKECSCHLPVFLFHPREPHRVFLSRLHLEGVRILDAVALPKAKKSRMHKAVWNALFAGECQFVRVILDLNRWLKKLVLRNVTLEGKLFERRTVVVRWKDVLKQFVGVVWTELGECRLAELKDGPCGREAHELGKDVLEDYAKQMLESKHRDGIKPIQK
ncbi:hypothetical protein BJ508DRAFT_418668 [Ascobolus immersus RN42]|uniref:Uncharacterized protein n=1 Tax=Ascobolus immersus RN42 TaxID=1160509 RepID=A0A3N4HKI1_ASCIM|nr:hypothetical protein BJ508DRAFT_418668 [Ascobolus immersus RN42]